MYVVDTSVWVARLLRRDPHHRASADWLEAQFSRFVPLHAPLIVLPEIAGAISRRSGRPRFASRAVEATLLLPSLLLEDVGEALARRAAELAADLGLAGADAVYLALAEALDVPLVTWDSDPLERAAPRARTPLAAGLS